MRTDTRIIYDEPRTNRVVFFVRSNGMFGFDVEEWAFEYWPNEPSWYPADVGKGTNSFYGSEEIALREALVVVPWLSAALERAG